jgi:hypothetical protein
VGAKGPQEDRRGAVGAPGHPPGGGHLRLFFRRGGVFFLVLVVVVDCFLEGWGRWLG